MYLKMLNIAKLLTFFLLHYVLCEKVFKSVPVTLKIYENETVLLPCYLDSHEAVRVRWYKANRMLGDSMDGGLLLPHRFRMLANFTLQVDSVRAEDSDEYTCEVLRPEPWGPIRQTHSIQVQYSPTVKTIPEDGFVEVKKGEYVDIGCEVHGTPAPVVDWKKNGESMALLEHRSRIKFKAEHRALAGVYECTASNGVGDPVTAVIRVVVLDAPEVSAIQSWVHTAVGLRAVLSARVVAAPPPSVRWYKDRTSLAYDHDRIMTIVQGDDVYQLIFRSVQPTDFGNYTFRAENQLGMADVSFKLTGVPNAASFKVEAGLNKATPTSFTLIWEVDSYSTIIEYNLWLRPYYGRRNDDEATEPPSNTWRKITVPGDVSDGPIHSARYTVRGLTPSTVYEAIVTSRNKYGWSKQSAILHFATEPGTGRRPSTSDYTDITPLLEPQEEPEPHNITQAQVFGQKQLTSGSKREAPFPNAILKILTLTAVIFGFGLEGIQ